MLQKGIGEKQPVIYSFFVCYRVAGVAFVAGYDLTL